MGLDMYVFKSKTKPEHEITCCEANEDGVIIRGRELWANGDEQLHYFRKHPDLHGYFAELWRGRGGPVTDWTSFNGGDGIEITEDILEHLEMIVNQNALPHTEGFFFGESRPEDKPDTLEMIRKCREAIKEGFFCYYTSSW